MLKQLVKYLKKEKMIQVLRKFRILPLILGALMVTQVGTAHAAIQIVANDAQQVFVDRQVVGFPKIEKNQGGNTFDLVSHGRPGELLIDGEWKDASKIVAFLKFQIAPQTKHINIYGCEFAKGEKGMQAIAYIEKALGVSIAASNNITGKDGDWTLEVGQVLTAITVSNYQGNLQNLVNNGSFSGSASGWSLSGASYIGWSNHDQMMNLNEGNGNYNGSGEQYINTIVGNTYTITFDAHNHKTSTYSSDWDQTFNLTLGSSTQSITVPAQGGNHGFIGYSRTFTATSTSTLIKFQHAGTNSVEHDILIDNVSIAYVAPPCNAGNTPPALSSTTATNLCPAIGVNLNSYVTNVGSKNLVWYTNNTHTGSPITYSSSANAGTYYAFFYDAVNNCYSPVSSPLTVTINACTFTSPSCAIFNYIQNPSFEQYTSCPSTGLINSLQTNAKYWSNVGTAELMIVNSTCAAGNPTASSGTGVWSGST